MYKQRGGWEDFSVYHIKNSGEGRQIFRFLHEKQCIAMGGKDKRGVPFTYTYYLGT